MKFVPWNYAHYLPVSVSYGEDCISVTLSVLVQVYPVANENIENEIILKTRLYGEIFSPIDSKLLSI